LRKHLLHLIAGAFALCLAPLLSASPIAVDAGWYGFCFDGVGSSITAGCQNAATAGTVGDLVTFTTTGPVLFKITDAFQKGDAFSVDINSGAFVFTTSSVPTDGSGSVTDPDTAFADRTYSHGSILLGAGSYSINVKAASSPFESGGGYLQVASATVPEPGALFMLGTGLAVLLFGKRRLCKI
jgi:PEP-CTERM motif